MAHPNLPKDEVVERLTRVFRREGYEGASLARLSEATGLGRSSLYHHFPRGKEDMAEAVLAASRDRIARLVLVPLAADGTVRERFVAMARGFGEFYGNGNQACLTELFGIGTPGKQFIPVLTIGIARMKQAIGDVLVEAGFDDALAQRRAEDALIAIHGALVLSRAGGSTALFQRVLEELPDRLLS
ncbi:MAG TPA: helix-turn-helix domain-containing protein [Aliidongia sp.]|uniref:TetR/AcrR family transcriptional regulator n=1 Tax=Aliidongia sp. TaxID=1914230 RepID=UPI002DDCA656|nr:helix-turn-helix domain-containing protein [Aliidongia sp.]HEV2673422.1 helix-turn-helix domain-containing protein [Aliidongia sp.]